MTASESRAITCSFPWGRCNDSVCRAAPRTFARLFMMGRTNTSAGPGVALRSVTGQMPVCGESSPYRSSADQLAFDPRGCAPGAGGSRFRETEPEKRQAINLTRCGNIPGAAWYYKRRRKREPFILFIIVIVADTDGHVQH